MDLHEHEHEHEEDQFFFENSTHDSSSSSSTFSNHHQNYNQNQNYNYNDIQSMSRDLIKMIDEQNDRIQLEDSIIKLHYESKMLFDQLEAVEKTKENLQNQSEKLISLQQSMHKVMDEKSHFLELKNKLLEQQCIDLQNNLNLLQQNNQDPIKNVNISFSSIMEQKNHIPLDLAIQRSGESLMEKRNQFRNFEMVKKVLDKFQEPKEEEEEQKFYDVLGDWSKNECSIALDKKQQLDQLLNVMKEGVTHTRQIRNDKLFYFSDQSFYNRSSIVRNSETIKTVRIKNSEYSYKGCLQNHTMNYFGEIMKDNKTIIKGLWENGKLVTILQQQI